MVRNTQRQWDLLLTGCFWKMPEILCILALSCLKEFLTSDSENREQNLLMGHNKKQISKSHYISSR